MRIHLHVKSYNDWLPVPDDVEVTPQDVASGRVKPAAGSGHLMRVPVQAETVVEAHITEADIINEVIFAYTDKGKQGLILTRHEISWGKINPLFYVGIGLALLGGGLVTLYKPSPPPPQKAKPAMQSAGVRG